MTLKTSLNKIPDCILEGVGASALITGTISILAWVKLDINKTVVFNLAAIFFTLWYCFAFVLWLDWALTPEKVYTKDLNTSTSSTSQGGKTK